MTRRLLLAAALVVVFATPAQAHVTVNPREAAKGSYAKLAFRVPNERDDAGTNRLAVLFPADHPLASVSVKPVPGWKATIERTKLGTPVKNDDGDETTDYVSKITWDGGLINPGEFQEFEVSVGPLPEDADTLVFKAVQTYAKGDPVAWIEEVGPAGEEPERPAPVLTLTAATDDHHDSAATAGEDDEAAAESETAAGATDEEAALAAVGSHDLEWGIVALFSGLIVLVIAVLRVASSSKKPAPTP